MEWYTAAEKFNQALASTDPTPGGGAAAAMAAAMGCSLALMAAQTTHRRKTTAPEVKGRLENAIHKLAALKTQLNHLIEEDGAAYAAYVVAAKLPKENPTRFQAMQDALAYAARVPADTATTAITCLRELDAIKEDIAPVILSDIYCGQHLLKSAVRCSVENIRANLAFIVNDELAEKLNKQIEHFLKSC
ncbi:MAG: cyclodeaminase/cyclohydrolase family protein [Elusimicrobiaceae bacterium]|nr:cyclodeaminase/cyclohydrolase family protein [Elusimicrobiaceae bacterium]